jgi:hypothetical protein
MGRVGRVGRVGGRWMGRVGGWGGAKLGGWMDGWMGMDNCGASRGRPEGKIMIGPTAR